MKKATADPKDGSTPSKDSADLEPARCGAKKRDGNPCQKFPMLGGRRCRLHGGASPQAQAKARERILGAADIAAQRLIEFMNDKRVPWPVRLSAARDLLDRAGLNAKSEVTLEVKPWEDVIDRIIVDVDPAQLSAEAQQQFEAWNAEGHEGALVVDAEVVEPEEPDPGELTAEPEPESVAPVVDLATFSSRPPARLDPDGLGRRTTRQRREP